MKETWLEKICPVCHSSFVTRRCLDTTHCSLLCARKNPVSRKRHSLKMSGRKCSEIARKRMSEAKLGIPFDVAHKTKLSLAQKGKRHRSPTKETKHKISQGLLKWVQTHPEALEKRSRMFLGRSNSWVQGKNSPNWKGGISSLDELIYCSKKYQSWRRKCLSRDGHICLECGRGPKDKQKLHVHHLIPFTLLLSRFLKEYSKFSIVKDKQLLLSLSQTYEPLWEISNGQTLCKECHELKKKETHTLIKINK